MSAPTITPEWGDDLLAIAEAVGVVTPSGRPHLTAPGTLLDLTALLAVETLAQTQPNLLDEPVPYVPTDHEKCGRCDATICRCEDLCNGLAEDACGHLSQPACEGCAPWVCSVCAAAWMRRDR